MRGNARFDDVKEEERNQEEGRWFGEGWTGRSLPYIVEAKANWWVFGCTKVMHRSSIQESKTFLWNNISNTRSSRCTSLRRRRPHPRSASGFFSGTTTLAVSSSRTTTNPMTIYSILKPSTKNAWIANSLCRNVFCHHSSINFDLFPGRLLSETPFISNFTLGVSVHVQNIRFPNYIELEWNSLTTELYKLTLVLL
jgi:hypothetical protein